LPLTLYITRARWRIAATPGVTEEFPMTVEILYLTAQIQRWVNARVARHLAAQAERLTR
jgi:hypothetical protein